jgi:hypothetical protein
LQLLQVAPPHAPPSHEAHVPGTPQAFALLATHAPLTGSQHSPGPQDSGWHTQRPFSQRCPAPQTWLPQRQPFGPGAQVSTSPLQLRQPGVASARQWVLSMGRHTPNAQHPLGQLAASHTQPPLRQRRPAAQGAVLPQRHAPAVLQRSLEPGAHWAHTPASLLHTTGSATPASALAIGSHRFPVQHPPSHEVVVQTQLTPMPASAHTWPGLQAELAPHAHAPLVQRSDRPPTPQAPQAAPAVPQVPLLCCAYGTHWPLLSQQPVGQLRLLHTHLPWSHSCPEAHTPASPQLHAPVRQLSLSAGGHETHAPASVPQNWNCGGL